MFRIIKIITKFLKKLNLDIKFFDKLFFNIGLNQISENRKTYENIVNIQQIELKVFSQNGEDGIIDYLLTKLKLIRYLILLELLMQLQTYYVNLKLPQKMMLNK